MLNAPLIIGFFENLFVNAMRKKFDENQIKNIINLYHLGTARSGAVVFWQVDTLGRVRYGKAMHYKPDLHRDKSKHPVGVHSLMGKYDFHHRQCFFGEHLLCLPENKNKPVCIVESEKTACICSEVIPECVWLATGGKNGVKWTEKYVWTYLTGRNVILFPDMDAHDNWTEKLSVFRSFGMHVKVSEILKKYASEPQQDIADLIIMGMTMA